MSRLIIKNVPSYLTPDKLREHFSQYKGPGGTLTDVQLPRTSDGTSRRFAFIGYKTEAEARAAQQWFDRTYIDSTRIKVEVVERGARDGPEPRPNKRRRLDDREPGNRDRRSSSNDFRRRPSELDRRSSFDDQHPSTNPSDYHYSGLNAPRPKSAKQFGDSEQSRNNGDREKQSDARLEEFMKVMKPRTTKTRTWANEEEPSSSIHLPSSKGQKKQTTRSPSPSAPDHPVSEPPTPIAEDDLAWMQRRMAKGITLKGTEGGDENIFMQSDDEVDEVENALLPIPAMEEDSTKGAILKTGRLFLRNLAYSCTEDDLLDLFKFFGAVSQAHIPVDHTTKQPKGMAYVTFAKPEGAVAAFEALDKTSFQGRLLHILPAVDRKGTATELTSKKSLKDERLEQRKTGAGKDFNWSMLYMNADAVASSIADRMKISKADILNPEPDALEWNPAVKLALAETHIIQETKSYLKSQGVIISAFGSRSRSDVTILVKNIPYGTDADQIQNMFSEHGELRRVIVPPAGTMAVVEFVHADDASRAFRSVAYRRLGNSIIYLERAPLGIFDADPATSEPTVVNAAKPVIISDTKDAAATEVDGSSAATGSTLFVKNLAFATTTERLDSTFRNLPGFAFARVQTKPDPQRPDGQSRLSMGFGFVGFKNVEDAKKAMRSMHGFVLDGHSLVVKFAARGTEVEKKDKATAKGRTTKMIVKNVPFEATRKDIRDLFGSYGHLKSVRLPKRFDSRSRGFAFLDFVSRQEAENAYGALRHTHLLGRHLVLDWAEEDEDIDMLRRKAGVGFGDGEELPGRKRKMQFDEDAHRADDGRDEDD